MLEKAVKAGLADLPSYVPLFNAAVDYHVRRLRTAAQRHSSEWSKAVKKARKTDANASEQSVFDAEAAHTAMATPLTDARFWFERADTFFTENADQNAVAARQVRLIRCFFLIFSSFFFL